MTLDEAERIIRRYAKADEAIRGADFGLPDMTLVAQAICVVLTAMLDDLRGVPLDGEQA